MLTLLLLVTPGFIAMGFIAWGLIAVAVMVYTKGRLCWRPVVWVRSLAVVVLVVVALTALDGGAFAVGNPLRSGYCFVVMRRAGLAAGLGTAMGVYDGRSAPSGYLWDGTPAGLSA